MSRSILLPFFYGAPPSASLQLALKRLLQVSGYAWKGTERARGGGAQVCEKLPMSALWNLEPSQLPIESAGSVIRKVAIDK